MKIAFLGNFETAHSSENMYLRALEDMGHEVAALQERAMGTAEIEARIHGNDLFFWVHTHGWRGEGGPMREVIKNLRNWKIPSVGYHLDLWMGLNRMDDLAYDDYWLIDDFFTADKAFAAHLNSERHLPRGHYLKPGTALDECFIDDAVHPYKDVVFIGSRGYHPEWSYRPVLVDWLKNNYGERFEHWGSDGLGEVRGAELNRLCASSKVIVGDSLSLNPEQGYYWSERIYDQIGRGAFMIHPWINGLEEEFTDGKHVVFYKFGDFKDLKDKINYYLEHDEEREEIRRAGQKLVKDHCTYTHRLKDMLDALSATE